MGWYVSGQTARSSHPSGAAVADRHLVPLDDHRDLALTAGGFQHLLKFRRIRLDVIIFSPAAVSRPGLIRIGSACLPVNNHFSCHGFYPSLIFTYQGVKNYL